MKKHIFSIGFIVAVFLVLLYYVFFIDDPKALYNALQNASWWPLVVSFILMVLYWIFEALAQYFVMKNTDSKLSFYKVFKVTMVGQLFNCITPSASGGQPMQTYQMTKYGLHVGESACVLLVRFLIYQIVMVLYSLILLIFKLPYFNHHVSNFSSLAIVGFIVNFFCLLALVLSCFYPKFLVKIASWGLNLLHKIKIIKHPKEKIEKITSEVEGFHTSFKYYKGHLRVSILPALFSALQLTAFWTVPYFVCLSLGVDMPFDIAFAAAALTFMISSFVPLPGGSGGAEGAFALLFSASFMTGGKSVALAVLLWRVFTFYLPIIVGSGFFIIEKRAKKC